VVEATRIGRDLFHRTADPAVSSNGLACASCHPEGRDDGLTWSTSSGPRQTLMLAGRMGHTAPYGWNGQRPDLTDYVQTTVGRLGGAGISQPLIASIVDYLGAVPPPPAPAQGGDATERVARGRRLFFDAAQGCSSCHVGATGTDQHQHDVGSQAKGDDTAKFDTPTLRFVRGTGPWFHDGRYSSLDELLAARDSKMGHSAQLPPDDRAALAAFLESL
jgi:cytochrome c peroxidase